MKTKHILVTLLLFALLTVQAVDTYSYSETDISSISENSVAPFCEKDPYIDIK